MTPPMKKSFLRHYTIHIYRVLATEYYSSQSGMCDDAISLAIV